MAVQQVAQQLPTETELEATLEELATVVERLELLAGRLVDNRPPVPPMTTVAAWSLTEFACRVDEELTLGLKYAGEIKDGVRSVVLQQEVGDA